MEQTSREGAERPDPPPAHADNPFAAPETTSAAGEAARRAFTELSTKQLKKLRDNNSSISALSILWAIGAIPSVAYGLLVLNESGQTASLVRGGVLVLVGFLQGIAATGCFVRAPWARIIAMVVCGLMLLSVPLGTLIGILGLIALAGSRPLFGRDRLVPREIKAEYRHRKAEGIP